ncbi:MAG: nucleotide pyrophosphohydrolase [Planctomycetes bacterium]|nr:nucleotide pyrophosphohydrolase [Planctomycetota bacterium]
MKIHEFQQLIERTYGARDRERGLAGTHMWFSEEVGELARALRRDRGDIKDRQALEAEFADVLAWLSTLASIAGVDLEKAALDKYQKGCPRCGAIPCNC